MYINICIMFVLYIIYLFYEYIYKKMQIKMYSPCDKNTLNCYIILNTVKIINKYVYKLIYLFFYFFYNSCHENRCNT